MLNPVELTKELIRYNSISANSNCPISDYLADHLDTQGFTVEQIKYRDTAGVEKASVVGRKGEGVRMAAPPTAVRGEASMRIWP